MSEQDFKGWVHAGVAVVAGMMLGYNLMRFCAHRKTRNAVNVAIYAPLVIHELRQAQYHWRGERQ